MGQKKKKKKKKEQSGLARQLGGHIIKLAHANTHTCLLVARRLSRPCSSPSPGYDHHHHSQLAGKERLETLLVMSNVGGRVIWKPYCPSMELLPSQKMVV